MNYNALQKDHMSWLDRMYPNQAKWMPALGMVEEAGELIHTVLKLSQYRYFGAEARYPTEGLHEAMVDAIGDCSIFVCSACNAMDWNFATLLQSVHPIDFNGLTLQDLTVALMRAACDFAHTLWYAHLLTYATVLNAICRVTSVDFDSALQTTWDEVKERKR